MVSILWSNIPYQAFPSHIFKGSTLDWGEDVASKLTCHQDCQPKFDPWGPKCGRREPTAENCPLTATPCHSMHASPPHSQSINQSVNVIKARIGICQKLLRTRKNFSSLSGSLILSPVTCHPQSHPQSLAYWKTLRSMRALIRKARKQDGISSQCSITGWVEH